MNGYFNQQQQQQQKWLFLIENFHLFVFKSTNQIFENGKAIAHPLIALRNYNFNFSYDESFIRDMFLFVSKKLMMHRAEEHAEKFDPKL